MKIKNKTISPKTGIRIVVYSLLAYWVLTAYERIEVITKHELPIEMSFKSFKYFMGLTVSAEELDQQLNALKRLESLEKSFKPPFR